MQISDDEKNMNAFRGKPPFYSTRPKL